MSTKSSSVSKRMRTATNTNTDVKMSKTGNISAGSAGTTSELPITEDVANNTAMDALVEDILLEIFDNLEILTVKDLLNFRLVNRCWRDAATSVLLRRSLCEIALDFGKVGHEKDNANGNNSQNIPSSYKYFNAYDPTSFLLELSGLISTSPKFPSTSIRFHSKCVSGFGNLCPTSDLANANAEPHQIDLFHFLSLYGKKIKKLSFESGISKIAVQNLLYVHMPHLVCLNLESFLQFSSEDQEAKSEGSQIQVCHPPPTTLAIKEICVGYQLQDKLSLSRLNFVQELIHVSPNLSAIQDVDVATLAILLKMGKSHLIQSLYLDPSPAKLSTLKKFVTFFTNAKNNLSLKPKLSKIYVGFYNVWECECNLPFDAPRDAARYLNIILSGSKDSLKFLEITMNPSEVLVDILIPPLPHLKSLSLIDITNKSLTTRIHFLGDVVGRAIRAGEVIANQSVHEFDALSLESQGNRNTLADYFPRLRHVELQAMQKIENNPGILMNFFSLEDSFLGSTIPGDIISTVTTLQLALYSSYRNFGFINSIGKLFPNVSNVRIVGQFSIILQNWTWTAFEKLERLKIYEDCRDWKTQMVDSFFTGISPGLCAQFETRSNATSSTALESGPAHLAKRTQSYIGDCTNLKEFTICFEEKMNSKFASKLTAMRGFQDVIHSTKIIFSFESVTMSVKEMKETHLNLEPVADFVEIRMKK